MRNKAFLSVLLSLFVFLCFSCASGNIAESSGFSESDAVSAMEVALSTAIINSCEDFMKLSLPTNDFIPGSYLVLKQSTEEVTGLSKLLGNWSQSLRDFIEESYSDLSEFLLITGSRVRFRNAVSFVRRSNTSGTEYFLRLYGPSIKEKIHSVLEQADTSFLEKARIQYNIHVKLTNFTDNKSIPMLEECDAVSELTEQFYQIFSQLLKENEDLFRTTPDPFGDPVIAAVFGNE